MASWPLPARKLELGFRRVPRPGFIRTPFDVGEPQQRRRTSRYIYDIQGVITVNDSELTSLYLFYHTTIEDGALRFDWQDPQLGDTQEFRFVAPPQEVGVSPNGTKVNLALEMFRDLAI